MPAFTVVDHIPQHLKTEVTRYPKAGDPNPRARLGILSASGGKLRWVDLSRYDPQDLLIVRVGWTPDSRSVVFQAQNREQTWLDLNLASTRTGKLRRLIRETSPAWVNVLGQPRWLKDNSFLWFSEQSGWRHLYHYRRRKQKGTECFFSQFAEAFLGGLRLSQLLSRLLGWRL